MIIHIVRAFVVCVILWTADGVEAAETTECMPGMSRSCNFAPVRVLQADAVLPQTRLAIQNMDYETDEIDGTDDEIDPVSDLINCANASAITALPPLIYWLLLT